MNDQWIAQPTSDAPAAPPLTQGQIDQRVFDLYDEYCHGRLDRRAFLQQAAAVTIGGLAMAQALLPPPITWPPHSAPTCRPLYHDYGAAAETASVPAIRAAVQVHYAEHDERINALWPGYEAALQAHGTTYEMHIYPGTQHGFHNNSTPRYHEASAKLAWERTVAFLRKHLA